MAVSGNRGGLIAALDVGSSKVCCFIARADLDGKLTVEGIGHQLSRGIKAGTVIDVEAVEESIRAAVDAAERMANETISQVYLNLSNGRPHSDAVRVEVRISGDQVDENDIRNAISEATKQFNRPERDIIHAIPVVYSVDGAMGIHDPRGMYGDQLGVDIHIVTVEKGPTRNLRHCLERGHLGIAGTVVSPYASGLSCLVEDEREIGVTLIDMGGGTTTTSVFMEGSLVYADVVPIGGQHVTNDIARGLLTSISDAERMKTLHGSAIRSSSDDSDTLTITQVGEHGSNHTQEIPQSVLMGIIQPRLEEIFETVHDHLITSGYDQLAGKRVVLTGGASQLQGVGELASRILNKNVRPGKPDHINGLAEATVGPAFATCAGLLAYATQGQAHPGMLNAAMLAQNEPKSAMARVGRWLKDNF
jgi:cell division protein FtsA